MGDGPDGRHRPRPRTLPPAPAQWQVVREGYPAGGRVAVRAPQRESSAPPRPGRARTRTIRHDADRLMYWFMGNDTPAWKTVGGAVAPRATRRQPFATAPVHAASGAVTPASWGWIDRPSAGRSTRRPRVLYAPSTRRRLRRSSFQVSPRGVLTGWASVLSGRRVWWPVADARHAPLPRLPQRPRPRPEPVLSLAIVVWGWVLASRGRDGLGGVVWGLLRVQAGLGGGVLPRAAADGPVAVLPGDGR